MKRAILLFSLIVFTLSSCDKGFEELNENPTAPTEVTYGAIFNELVNSLRLGWNRQLFIHNEILYDVTELGVVTAGTFGNIEAGVEDIWRNYYNALQDARQLRSNLDELTKEDPEAADVVKAQINILLAYKTFQLLDLFGDMPYSEAGMAYAENPIVRPVYDDDREVYLSLLEDLRQASDFLISASGNTPSGNAYLRLSAFDALFNDNLGLWAKFSNSLQLKYLVRIHNAAPQIAADGVENLLTGGYSFILNTENVVMHPATQGWSNQGANWSFREHNKLRMGTTMWDFLTENNEILDPRAAIFFETNNADEWTPFPQVPNADTPQSGGAPYDQAVRDNSYTDKGSGNIYSPFNFYLIRDEQNIPEILLSHAEVKFILAEVFIKGIGVAPDEFLAEANYREGMMASIAFWQDIVTGSAIWQNQPTLFSIADAFNLTQHPKYKFEFGGAFQDNLQKIYTQRWVDLFRQPWEAFSLMRQTDLLPRAKPENTFYRFKYPVSESSFNYDNWLAQSTEMGGDETNIKLWWME